MKFIRNSWLVTGTAALGLIVAACSSKTADNGGGGGTANTSSSGGAASDTGGKAPTGGGEPTGGRTPTGGQASTPGGNTGGGSPISLAGGSSSFDPTTYCNGIFKDKSCGQTSLSADVRVVNMLIVLDESGSMNDLADTNNPSAGSKWTIMNAALTKSLTATKNDINFGLLLFPYGGDPTKDDVADVCAVPPDASTAINIPIGAGPTTVPSILDKVSKQNPSGGTPTADALNRAYDYFATGDGRLLQGTRWVLLATDGGPNCNQGLTTCTPDRCTQNIDGKCPSGNCCDGYSYICLDDSATISAIAQLYNLGVKTFVVGVPGTAAYASTLNAMANAGKVPNTNGTSAYYAISAASAQADLEKAFGDITTQLVHTCDIPLSATPLVTQDKVNIAIDCKLQTALPPTTLPDAGNADGFYIDYNQKPAHLFLVGAPCTSIQTVGATHVDVIAGCQGIN